MSQTTLSAIKTLFTLIALFALFASSLEARRTGTTKSFRTHNNILKYSGRGRSFDAFLLSDRLRADGGGGPTYALSDANCMKHPSCYTNRICPTVCYNPTRPEIVLSDAESACMSLCGNNLRSDMACAAVCAPNRLFTAPLGDQHLTIDDLMRYVNKAEKIANVLGYERPSVELSDVSSGYKMSHEDALRRVRNADINIHSSGGCHDRNNRSCTSLDGVNSGTIDKIIILKNASGCPITITGGTEVGHASGTYSHANGYKLDISLNTCINNYIQSSFTYSGRRSDGAEMWKASSGSIYAKEGNHWDIMYP